MSHAWGNKLKQATTKAGKAVASTASNVKDQIEFQTAKKTKDTEFIEIQKEFDEQNKLITTVTSDVVSFISGAEAILNAQLKIAEDLLKIAPENSPMASLCKQQIDTVNQMLKTKSETIDKQLQATFTDPVNVYQGQYREISDRIRERARRELEMEKLAHERDKYQEKADARLAATETKLEAAISSFEDLNTELKRDIPVLLSKAADFFSPLILLMIINQSNFWSQMSQFTVALAGRVDTSKAFIPEIQQCITPKQSSAVTKKYSTMQSNPWEKAPATPAIAYGTTTTPALPSPYNNVPPQPLPPAHPAAVHPAAAYGGPVQTGAVPPGPALVRPSGVRPPPSVPQTNNVPVQPQSYVPQPGNPFAQHHPVATPPVPGNPFAGGRPLPQQAPPKPQAKALWDFNANNHDELSFKAGDIIIIHEKNGDWWKGELNGRQGVLPANYVQPL